MIEFFDEKSTGEECLEDQKVRYLLHNLKNCIRTNFFSGNY